MSPADSRREGSMGQAIRITNLEYSAADVRRLMALALILEGKSRSEAAEQSGMERQTLRDWVHRYNTQGVAGLSSRVGPGPPRLLNAAQMAELKALVVNGPDPETDTVVRWRCVDLRDKIEQRFSVRVHK